MILQQTAIFLTAAVVAVPIFKRLGLGAVLGYLAAGILIGPSALGFVQEVEDTMHFAEFGVVLLLFVIGLELEPARLFRMRRDVFGLGSAQVVTTASVFAALAWALGLPPATAVVTGFGLSLSSTALVLQLLGEKSEMSTPHGRAAFGILLFQDVAAIPALAVIPLLGAGRAAAAEGGSALRGALVALAVVVGLVLVGRFLLRPIFRIIASARSHELSVGWALLVVVGTALVMQRAGLSMALGSFLAGVLLADSEYRHELESNIEPFKGLLLGLFFMSVGMAADLAVVTTRPLTVLGLVVGIVAAKFAVLVVIGRLAKLGNASAASLGVALAQGGEFAFVLYGLAASVGVLAAPEAKLLVVVVTLSMVATPLAFVIRDRVLRAIAARGERPFDRIDEPENPVIIAGFGRYGQIVARLLRVKRIRFTALEVSHTQVDFVRRFGNRIYYGDASRVDLLRSANAGSARVFVLAVDDPEASVRIARTVREHFPSLTVVARARNRQHVHALRALGVEHITRELFPASLDTAAIVLEALGLSSSEARDATRRFGEFDEEALRAQFAIRDDEAALIASAKKAADDLEKLFDIDEQAKAS